MSSGSSSGYSGSGSSSDDSDSLRSDVSSESDGTNLDKSAKVLLAFSTQQKHTHSFTGHDDPNLFEDGEVPQVVHVFRFSCVCDSFFFFPTELPGWVVPTRR